MTKKKRLSGKWKIGLLILGAVLLVLGAVYTLWIYPNLDQETWVYKETEITKGNLSVGVTESGSLSYATDSLEYTLDLDTSGDSSSDTDTEETDSDSEDEETVKYLEIETMDIAMGQKLEAGDPILTFTTASVEKVRANLQAALTEAQNDYAEAQTTYQVDALSARETYETALTTASYAQAIYENTLAALSANITSLEQQIANYSEEEETTSSSQTMGGMSGSGGGSQSLSLKELQQELAQAQSSLSMDQLEAKQTYEASVSAGETAQLVYENTLASLQTTLDEAQEDAQDAQDLLDTFNTFVGDGTLYAEEAGTVTAVSYEAGDSLTQTGSIYTYAKTTDMTISVDVSQEDIVTMAVGDSVEIVFGAYEDETYEGTIQSITTTQTSSGSATVSYPVTILVEGDTSALYGGMTADVTFVTESRTDVLYISEKALVEQDGSQYVYVEQNGSYVLTPVETGLGNGVYVEITDGLSETDTIYVATKVTSEASASSEADEENTEASGTDATTDGTNSGSFGDMPSGNGMQQGGQSGMQGMPGSNLEGK